MMIVAVAQADVRVFRVGMPIAGQFFEAGIVFVRASSHLIFPRQVKSVGV